ncbi:MAG: DUF5119 domain-containing protein [Bacteroides sp.]|nr:DUF5119 domain-containing protein [Bacteroides sp.]
MRRVWIMLLLLMGVMASCDHKELCLHYPHKARIRVNVDWSEFTEETPTGMTVMTYSEDGSAPSTVLSNTLDHVYVNLEEGNHHVLTFNQSTSEFGSFLFKGMDRWEDAKVVSNIITSRWYTGRSSEERVASEPEWLAIDSDGEVEVTKEMAETFSEHMGTKTKLVDEFVVSTQVPKNVIYTLHAKVHVDGIYNLRSARAALSGISEGVKFATLQRSDDVVTQLLEEWKMTVNKDDPTKGYIEASFKCFGFPHSHQGDPEENRFQISVLLVDNKTQLDFEFQVGHLIEIGDYGELTLYLELDLPTPLPDVQPEGGSSGGFDATVDDWGEEIEHDITM